MEDNKRVIFAYDFLKKEVCKHYTQKCDRVSEKERASLLSDLKDALFGLETLSDEKIRNLVQNPQAYFYIMHNLPLPKRLKQSDENTPATGDYQQVINNLRHLGVSARKMQKFRNRVRPFLIAASLLSAGTALYAITSKHNPKPALISSVASLTLLVHNRRQNDLLPPYPKTPDLTR